MHVLLPVRTDYLVEDCAARADRSDPWALGTIDRRSAFELWTIPLSIEVGGGLDHDCALQILRLVASQYEYENVPGPKLWPDRNTTRELWNEFGICEVDWSFE